MLTYLLWFLAGAITHKLFSYFMALGVENIILNETLLKVARLFQAITYDVNKALEFKHKSLKSSDVPDTIIKNTITQDKLFLSKWKTAIFTTIVLSVPPKYIRFVPTYIWDEDIDLDSIIKRLEEGNKDEH